MKRRRSVDKGSVEPPKKSKKSKKPKKSAKPIESEVESEVESGVESEFESEVEPVVTLSPMDKYAKKQTEEKLEEYHLWCYQAKQFAQVTFIDDMKRFFPKEDLDFPELIQKHLHGGVSKAKSENIVNFDPEDPLGEGDCNYVKIDIRKKGNTYSKCISKVSTKHKMTVNGEVRPHYYCSFHLKKTNRPELKYTGEKTGSTALAAKPIWDTHGIKVTNIPSK